MVVKTNKVYVKAYRSASTFSKAPTLFLTIMSAVGTEIRSIDFGDLLSVALEHFSRIFLLSIMLVTSAVLSGIAHKLFSSLVSLADFPAVKFQPRR
jgi:hypothetical protein